MQRARVIIATTLGAAMLLAGAVPSMAADRGARVIDDQPCAMRDGDGNSVVVPTSHIVITPSGNALLTCHARGVANSSGKFVRSDYRSTGRLCGFEGGVTKDWLLTVTPKGNATLVCHVRGR